MTISGLLKSTKTVEIKKIKVTIKKYPLAFYEYLNLKSLEGKSFSTDKLGKIKAITGVGNYDLDLIAEKLFYGLSSWELVDEKNFSIELTKEACLTVAIDYADFASEIIKAIEEYNQPLNPDEKKSLS